MEYKQNLLERRKSKLRIALGFVFIVYSIFYFIDKFLGNSDIRTVDWISIIIFALNGLVHTMEGFGYSTASLFGKAYLTIDKNAIVIKERVIHSEHKFHWDYVKSVSANHKSLQISMINGLIYSLKYSKYGYSEGRQIKQILYQIATEKGIATTGLNPN